MIAIRLGGRVLRAGAILATLTAIAIIVAVATPEAPGSTRGGRSSLSTGPGGVGIMFELAERMGWSAERRLAPLDSVPGAATVQVVLAPDGVLGVHEVDRLLDNVRRGGGLIFALDADEIADTLGLDAGRPARFLADYTTEKCSVSGSAAQSFGQRAMLAIPPEVRQIVWRHPAPSPVEVLVSTRRGQGDLSVGVGFRLGAGKIAVVSTSEIFANDVVRQCGWGADIALARVLEYVRPTGTGTPRLVFDEFHHGFGVHGGSLSAIARYLSHTASGHFAAQALFAGLILLIAMAPRPILPREPERIARRSPLEHADALGHAYADVGAARVATSLLVSGLRRRAGRAVPGAPRLNDDAFLEAAAMRFPAAVPSIDAVRRGLRESVTPRELDAIGDAVRDIEMQLTTTIPHLS